MTDLAERLDALEALAALERDHGIAPPGDGVDDDDQRVAVLERSRSRLRHGSGFVVAALAGPTGAGKSTLFNALAGAEVAQSGVRRPTTFATQALIWGDDATALCDWLGVSQRHQIATPGLIGPGHENLRGLVVLDLPDFDSIEDGNRAEVDRLVQLVDVFIWVADPQKYADESLHAGYLQRLAEHSDVMRFVLSKADTLASESLDACVADFARLLRADAISDPQVLAVSASTGEGLDELRNVLSEVAAERSAMVARIDADLRALTPAAATLVPADPKSRRKADERLVAALADAAGAREVERLVAAQHTLDGRTQLGWPPLRWLQKFRKRPIAELPTLKRSATMEPQINTALRDYADSAGVGLDRQWHRSLVHAVSASAPDAAQRLDVGVSASWRQAADRPAWWSTAAALQWTIFGTAVVGLVWLLLLFVVESFLHVSIVDYTPSVWNAPLPTWLLLGGLAAGLLLTLALRVPLAIASNRRGRRARLGLERQAERVVTQVIEPAASEPLNAALKVHHLSRTVAGQR